jgi:hypothetical protein
LKRSRKDLKAENTIFSLLWISCLELPEDLPVSMLLQMVLMTRELVNDGDLVEAVNAHLALHA